MERMSETSMASSVRLNYYTCVHSLDNKEYFDFVTNCGWIRGHFRAQFNNEFFTVLCSEWTLAKVAHTSAFKQRYQITHNGSDAPKDCTPEELADLVEKMIACRVKLSDDIPINEFHFLPDRPAEFSAYVMQA
jgi:hypothetical protein